MAIIYVDKWETTLTGSVTTGAALLPVAADKAAAVQAALAMYSGFSALEAKNVGAAFVRVPLFVDNGSAVELVEATYGDATGLTVVRPLHVFGYDDAPGGHAELRLDGVRVPAENLILGEGRGFEIAQGRLGPGRIHHCMRLIGLAQRALEAMIARARQRVAFGRPLAAQGVVREAIAESRCAIEQARLLTLAAAAQLDAHGIRGAKDAIGMIKIVAPRMACEVIDRAMQIHGGGGLGEDHFLAEAYAGARALRLADGPDEVHRAALAKSMLQERHEDAARRPA